jgi:hypothetical protein
MTGARFAHLPLKKVNVVGLLQDENIPSIDR